MFASGPRNQRNCAALANESGELPVNLEPDWRSCRYRMNEHGVDYIPKACLAAALLGRFLPNLGRFNHFEWHFLRPGRPWR